LGGDKREVKVREKGVVLLSMRGYGFPDFRPGTEQWKRPNVEKALCSSILMEKPGQRDCLGVEKEGGPKW